MSEIVPGPDQPMFASPEQENLAKRAEMLMNRRAQGPVEGILEVIRNRVPAIEREREAVITDYADAGFSKMQEWMNKCDTNVLGTDFADKVEDELRQITPYLLDGDESHWVVREYYERALGEDAFREREDEWPESKYPLEEALKYIGKHAVGPGLESPLHPSQYRKQKDRWDNWYADGIDIDWQYQGSEEDGEGE